MKPTTAENRLFVCFPRHVMALVSLTLGTWTASPSCASDHGGHGGGEANKAHGGGDSGGHGGGETGGHGGGHGEAAASEAAPKSFSGPGVIDLGEFNLENFRPAHNKVASIRFSLCLMLAPGTSEATVNRLEHWRRRLRDQAIIAIRSVDPADLDDPQLARVQRLILLRIKRLPFTDLIEAAYLTDFALGEDE